MKTINKNSIIGLLSLSFMFSIALPAIALAVAPPLGSTATYGVLGSTYTNTTPTTINGDVGFTTGPAVAPTGTHINYGPGAQYSIAGTDQGNILSTLSSQSCTFTFLPGPIDLSTDITHGALGTYTPGVYCSTGAMSVGGPLNLSGDGTYIFRPAGALTTTAGSIITLTGTSACNVFWTPTQATTLGANTTFAGIVVDDAGITVGANTTWSGIALAFGGTVTTDTDIITTPSCLPPIVTVVNPTSSSTPNIPLIKVLKVPTPLNLPAGNGLVTYDYTVLNTGPVAMTNITITDNKCSPVVFISGDSNGDSKLDINETWKYRCTSIISQTTTNTVTVSGQANGFTANSMADATVTVSVPLVIATTTVQQVLGVSTTTVVTFPALPNTGIAPNENNVPWNLIALMCVFTISTLLIISKRKELIK